jgi:flagellar protein FlbB
MINLSDRVKIIYLAILILFVIIGGLFWLDYIGLFNLEKMIGSIYRKESPLVLHASDDEPSLVEKEEFEKEKHKLQERIEEIDKREALLVEAEKGLDAERTKIDDIKAGLDVDKKKLENEKKRNSGYERNVKDLASKIVSIRPDEAVQIVIRWEEPLIIDVLRRIDADAAEAGRVSVTSYLISLMPKEKASRIMYLMTQL